MTGWLASIAAEAEIPLVLPAGPDVLDLKDPAAGALGAWPAERIAATVRDLQGRLPVSATVGNPPMDPPAVLAAVRAIAATEVDVVKLGLVPEGAPLACLQALAPLAATGVRLVAVIFADRWDDMAMPLPAIAAAGFAGAMLDTAGKDGGGLRAHRDHRQLSGFVTAARRLGLRTGLAGALRVEDIADLLPLDADLLGFRGALCGGTRTAAVTADAVARVAQAMLAGRPHPA